LHSISLGKIKTSIMKRVITTERAPIKLWLDNIESGALSQAINLANLPFIFKHLAIMPDAHQGYGMPIGGVMATKGVIVPNAVGVDIGCGMCAVKTSLASLCNSDLLKIVELIKKKIPVGFSHQQKAQDENLMPFIRDIESRKILYQEYKSALTQLGTLGGGNHFIEIQKGDDGFIWIMIHSGSRNIGYKVAKYYNDLAISINEKYYSKVEKSQELAFLPIDTVEAKNYFIDMQYCVEFALANRKLMMGNVKEIFDKVYTGVTFEPIINIAHNYAKWEHHFKQDVIIHRKGATSAKLGEIGIIPGSMGTKSYIVEGLGNKESFNSCSHGAGRKMGRKQAQKDLNLVEEIGRMDIQGIVHSIQTEKDLDEAPGAYKNIDVVMENQKDLVKILVELKPLAVVKG